MKATKKVSKAGILEQRLQALETKLGLLREAHAEMNQLTRELTFMVKSTTNQFQALDGVVSGHVRSQTDRNAEVSSRVKSLEEKAGDKETSFELPPAGYNVGDVVQVEKPNGMIITAVQNNSTGGKLYFGRDFPGTEYAVPLRNIVKKLAGPDRT